MPLIRAAVCDPEAKQAWVSSSRYAADLYDAGVKLGCKEDLIEIERQLQRCSKMKCITLPHVNGSTAKYRNPIYHDKKSKCREPFIDFKVYWQLVHCQPNARLKFIPRITTAAPFSKIENMDYMEELDGDPEGPRGTLEWEVKGPCTHHAMAHTMASVAKTIQKKQVGAKCGRHIKLLAQEPAYTPAMETMFKEIGKFDIVGKYGASGFAELDDNCIVFAPFVNAPVKQTVADLARPAVIICNQIEEPIYHEARAPRSSNPESPRTRQMWRDYDQQRFPISADLGPLAGHVCNLYIYSRRT
ncbi:hypothetical protein Micbo1qcDRAFT_214430 [Microdochium bolleyi]|uniref:SRR1-like domain-containing protein n=1 Tax=Microdochium bolleyi TaxID=196109 RepID=A0A136IUF1_9PEZI|nr:hypothetical protein Micbo1qcDRAFT_214430 [Microdochium bolleyi]